MVEAVDVARSGVLLHDLIGNSSDKAGGVMDLADRGITAGAACFSGFQQFKSSQNAVEFPTGGIWL